MRARTAAFIASIIAVAGAPAALAQDTVNPTPPAAGDASKVGPQLTLSKEIVEFGDVDDSKTISKMVTITNTGDQVLEIGNITVTCGCTASEVEQSQLQPGESTQLEVRFNPNRRTGEQHGKRVTIDSNDPRGASTVTLKAFVIPRVVAEPAAALFGQVIQGDSGTTQIKVMGMNEDFKVTGASIDREDSFGIRILETKIVEYARTSTGSDFVELVKQPIRFLDDMLQDFLRFAIGGLFFQTSQVKPNGCHQLTEFVVQDARKIPSFRFLRLQQGAGKLPQS